LVELTKEKLHSDGSVVNIIDPPPKYISRVNEKARRNWGFAFARASRSSKSILVALRWLRSSPDVYLPPKCVGTNWIVREMVEWLKVCVGTIPSRESTRNSNYWKGTNGRFPTTG